jgi:lipoprotein NlpD
MRSSSERQTIFKTGVCFVLALLLAACASQQRGAPVEERAVQNGRNGSGAPAPGAGASAEALKPLPGAENAGKPGYYTIKPGDTLIRVGLESGQNWRDIMRWNNIDNPNVLEVGQVLRVVPPGTDGTSLQLSPSPQGEWNRVPDAKVPAVSPAARGRL